MTRHLIVTLVAIMMAGCMKPELSPGEKFVRSKLPADFREIFYSTDGNVVCGEVGDARTMTFRRFYSHWKEQKIVYQGMEEFSLGKYVKACNVAMSDAEIASEEARVAAEKKAAELAKRQEDWLEKNGEAIEALHQAAKQLSAE